MKSKTRGVGGQAMVEFALILLPLLIILLGVFDVGRLVYASNAVSNAAREAGRTAIVNQTVPTIRNKASQAATALGIPSADPGNCPADGGPTTAASGVCVAFLKSDGTQCSPPAIGCQAVVSVKWSWQSLAPLIGNLIGPQAVTATTRQAVESLCANNVPISCPIR